MDTILYFIVLISLLVGYMYAIDDRNLPTLSGGDMKNFVKDNCKLLCFLSFNVIIIRVLFRLPFHWSGVRF